MQRLPLSQAALQGAKLALGNGVQTHNHGGTVATGAPQHAAPWTDMNCTGRAEPLPSRLLHIEHPTVRDVAQDAGGRGRACRFGAAGAEPLGQPEAGSRAATRQRERALAEGEQRKQQPYVADPAERRSGRRKG